MSSKNAAATANGPTPGGDMPDTTLSVQDWLVLVEKPKLTNRYYATVALLVAQEMFEFYDFFLVGYLVSVLAPGWELTYGQSAVMLLSSGLGGVVVCVVGGLLADAVGRERMVWGGGL